MTTPIIMTVGQVKFEKFIKIGRLGKREIEIQRVHPAGITTKSNGCRWWLSMVLQFRSKVFFNIKHFSHHFRSRHILMALSRMYGWSWFVNFGSENWWNLKHFSFRLFRVHWLVFRSIPRPAHRLDTPINFGNIFAVCWTVNGFPLTNTTQSTCKIDSKHFKLLFRALSQRYDMMGLNWICKSVLLRKWQHSMGEDVSANRFQCQSIDNGTHNDNQPQRQR